MKKLMISLFLLSAAMSSLHAADSPSSEALQRLMEGNERFRDRKSSEARNKSGSLPRQNPCAIIVCCSDCRISPHAIFDQSLGSLFVLRAPGSVVGPTEVEGIVFAAERFGTPIVLVLGNQNCQVVQSVLKQKPRKDAQRIAYLIEPAVMSSKDQPGDPLKNAIIANVKQSIRRLHENSAIADRIRQEKLKILGGYYNAETGEIDIFP